MKIPHLNFASSSLVCGALLLGSCAKKEPAVAAKAVAGEIPVVAVAKTTPIDLSQGMVLTAEFRPYQEIEVMAKVSGYLKQINVDVGDRVQAGQLLATLEIPEMNDDIGRSKAMLDRASAEVTHAKEELARAQTAHEITHISFLRLKEVSEKRPGLVAQQEVDDSHSKDLVSEAQVAVARSNEATARRQVQVNESELKRMNTMYEYLRVTAPFAGVVTKRYADTGSMIQAGTASQSQAMPVVRLSQNNMLRLILPVPESAVSTVHIGQNVDVSVPSMKRTFPGRVSRFSGKVSLATRTMDTELDVPNPSLTLMPGMYAEVKLTLQNRSAVLSVPIAAVDRPEEQSPGKNTGKVVVVTANNRLEFRNIELGLESATMVEVLAGLNDGDLVVTGTRAGLQAGQEVKPKVVDMNAGKS